MTIRATFHGVIESSSVGEVFTNQAADGGYVASERAVARLDGRGLL